MATRALITGISGQISSYLAELLLYRGYEVYGLVRRVALEDPEHRLGRLANVYGHGRLHLIAGDLTSYASVCALVSRAQPDECYHLAAQSFVPESFSDPHTTMLVNVQGTLHVLEALRAYAPKCRMYFAATSEMFGKVVETPQCETTPFYPRSPYAASKVAGFHLVRNYREAYGMHVSSGICFNMESPRRGMEFVTRKISRGVAEIVAGKRSKLGLGNLSAQRDWGHARDAVEGMWLMLQQDEPDDYVLATGRTHSIAEFANLAFESVGLDYQAYVEIDPQFKRPAEVELLLGDATKAKEKLGWAPKTTFEGLVEEMVHADCEALGVTRNS